MSKYSDFRIGNLVLHYPKHFDDPIEYCRITEINLDSAWYTIRSVRTGEYFQGKQTSFEPILFFQWDWGFKQESPKYYTNSELLLYDYKEFKEFVGGGQVREFIDGVETFWEVDGVATFKQAGFKVKKMGTEDWLIDGTDRDKKSKIDVGLQFVHEFQNIYAEEFPEIVFDTDTFLRSKLKNR